MSKLIVNKAFKFSDVTLSDYYYYLCPRGDWKDRKDKLSRITNKTQNQNQRNKCT